MIRVENCYGSKLDKMTGSATTFRDLDTLKTNIASKDLEDLILGRKTPIDYRIQEEDQLDQGEKARHKQCQNCKSSYKYKNPISVAMAAQRNEDMVSGSLPCGEQKFPNSARPPKRSSKHHVSRRRAYRARRNRARRDLRRKMTNE
jgi:hypothetical protein